MNISKRIAVVGAGVVGVNTLLRLIDERSPGIHVTWIYDSKIPIFGVGESTTPDLPSQIGHSTTLTNPHLKKYFDATIKYGNKFIGFGTKHNFIRWLDLHSVGIHFDTRYFTQFFIKHLPEHTLDFELIDETITHVGFTPDAVHVNNHKFDFIIDCTGGESLIDQDQYIDSLIQSVNTSLVLKLPQSADWGVTISYAHRNGWMFGIPLQSRRTFGYNYNSNITTEEEALKDFRTIIPEALGYPYEKFSWKPRLSKYVLHHSGRYARNGNAVGFIEPLESLAGHYYDRISDEICEFALGNSHNDIDTINKVNDWYYTDVIDEWYKNLAWIYHFGSKYDSPFWSSIRTDSRDILNNKSINDFIILNKDQNFTEDLFNIIGDDIHLKRDFMLGRHDYIGNDLNTFCSNHKDFIEWVYGMGADYAHKFPLLVPPVNLNEDWGKLSFDSMTIR